jgi:hypothetical protein
MYSGKIVFTQVMDLLPLSRFRNCVERYRGDFKVKTFTCQDHFRVMAFAPLSHRESLRDIEICLSNANEVRDWRIYADFAQVLIHHARQLYADEDRPSGRTGTPPGVATASAALRVARRVRRGCSRPWCIPKTPSPMGGRRLASWR